MKNIFIISGRVLREFYHQPRTILMLLIAPIFAFTVFMKTLDLSMSSKIRLGIYGNNQPIEKIFAENDRFKVKKSDSYDKLDQDLINRKIDAIIDFKEDEPTVKTASTFSNHNSLILNILQQVFLASKFEALYQSNDIKKINIANTLIASKQFVAKNEYDISNFTLSNSMAPGFMSLMVFFFVLVAGSMAFLKERTSGTISRIMVSSLRPYELVGGYALSFMVLICFQILVMQLCYSKILHFSFNGSLISFFLLNILVACCALLMATALSVLAKTEFEIMQFIPALIMPQMILCGIFDLSSIPWLYKISNVLPITLGFQMMTDVGIKGKSLLNPEVMNNILLLLGYVAIFFALNVLALRKYKPKMKS